jgi:hypothetical protein
MSSHSLNSTSPFAIAAADADVEREFIRAIVDEAWADVGAPKDDSAEAKRVLSAVEDVIILARRCPHVLLTRDQCQTIGGWKKTTQLDFEERGYLRVVRIRSRCLVTAPSLFALLIKRAAAPLTKVRDAPHLRKPRAPRPPTSNELNALKRGNEGRRLAALARRAQAQEAEV